ncbi:NADAR family protein [Actinomadura flavalba]|uniref:NADAR family protein n=1 Tax=Actinomadura flavalba TaxID=1120938 RepID=UPI0005250E90|nr:NADAR family protein [Actinomadura flavalba]
MDVGELVRVVERAGRVKYLFFWGHRAGRAGAGPWCLSQWWPAAFAVDGVRYATAEHFMMAEKARLFGDAATRAAILAAPHPARAKDLGRRVRGYDDAVWDEHRYDVVVRANLAKFGQDEDLRRYLCETGDRVLVEASPVDRVWGIGLTADDARATRPADWPGRNLLGFALMDVRDHLRRAA